MRLTSLALLVTVAGSVSALDFFAGLSRSFSGRGEEDNSIIDDKYAERRRAPSRSSNLGCFLCTQLLSVTKHRVGLSQEQLRTALFDKCHALPSAFLEQCFRFVESSLPEIYFSLNYDLSSKNVCVSLQLCDADNPFAVDRLFPEMSTHAPPPPSSPPPPPSRAISPDPPAPMLPVVTQPPPPALPSTHPTLRPTPYDKIGGRLVIEEEVENERKELETDKRLTCVFCERMLNNAKNYAVSAKADITSFANSACSKLPKGKFADQCYALADKKVAELAKFVDHQVVEALWCAELNQC